MNTNPVNTNPVNVGLFRNIIQTFFAQTAGFAINLACGILIARCLGPVGRGDWAAITSAVSIIATFSYLSAGYAVVYLRSSRDFTRHELFRASLAISMAGTLICLAAGVAASLRLSHGAELSFRSSLLVYAFGQFFANLTTFVSMIYLADKNFKRANIIGLLPRLMVLSGYGLLLSLHHFTLLPVVITNIASSAVLMALVVFWFRSAFKEPVKHWLDALREMLKYGFQVWIGMLANSVTMRADQVIMAFLLPRNLLGLYAVSVTVAELVGFFAGAAGFVVGPSTAALEGAELVWTIEKSFRMTFVLVCCASCFLYIIGPFLIHIFYGAKYDAATVSFRWLVLASIPMSLFSISKDVLVSRGYALLNTRMQILGAFVTVTCCYSLIKACGLAGAGIASFVSYCVVAAVAVHFVSSTTGASLFGMIVPTKDDFSTMRTQLMKRARPAANIQ